MNMDGKSQQGIDFGIGALFSMALHALLLLILVLGLSIEADDEPAQEEESMEVVLDDTPPPLSESETVEPIDDAMEPDIEEPLEQEEEELALETPPEEEEEEEPSEDPPEDTPLDRYAVDQVTDDEEPDEADHVSDEAHRTEEETIAEVTTTEDVEPEDDPEAMEQEADTEREIAMHTPEEEFEEPDLVDAEEFDEPEEFDESEELDEPEELDEQPDTEEFQDLSPEDSEPQEAIAEDETREYRDPNEMFLAADSSDEVSEVEQPAERESIFEQDAATAREVLERKPGTSGEERPRRGRRLLSNWRDNEAAMRANLENFVPHIQPGNHTSVNARAAAHASYIARIHRNIHPKWAESFIPRMSRNFSSSDPINDQSLEVVVEIVIDASSGEVVETGRARPSGHDLFDAEASNIARAVGPQPDPPESIVSPDGKVYIHWTFWRDQRRCGTFGASIYRLQESGEQRRIGAP